MTRLNQIRDLTKTRTSAYHFLLWIALLSLSAHAYAEPPVKSAHVSPKKSNDIDSAQADVSKFALLQDSITLRAPKAPPGTSQQTYLLPIVSHARIGMSSAELFKARPQSALKELSGAPLLYLREETPADPRFEAVIYQFSDDRLYEIILIGREEGVADRVAVELLSAPPNAPDDRWIRDSGEGFDLIFWVYRKNFIIGDARLIAP